MAGFRWPRWDLKRIALFSGRGTPASAARVPPGRRVPRAAARVAGAKAARRDRAGGAHFCFGKTRVLLDFGLQRWRTKVPEPRMRHARRWLWRPGRKSGCALRHMRSGRWAPSSLKVAPRFNSSARARPLLHLQPPSVTLIFCCLPSFVGLSRVVGFAWIFFL